MKDKGVNTLNERVILRNALRGRQMTQLTLSERMNMKQSALSQNMARPRMSLGMFAKILDALNYDVVIVDRMSGEASWKLEVERPMSEYEDDV